MIPHEVALNLGFGRGVKERTRDSRSSGGDHTIPGNVRWRKDDEAAHARSGSDRVIRSRTTWGARESKPPTMDVSMNDASASSELKNDRVQTFPRSEISTAWE